MTEHPKHKGEKTEAIIIAEFIKKDYSVYLSFGDNKRFDLLLDTGDGVFKRVQCKTGRYYNGCVIFNTVSTQCNMKKVYRKNYVGKIDLFAIYNYEFEKIYIVPIDIVGQKGGACSLRIDPPKRNQIRSVKWAKDFELK